MNVCMYVRAIMRTYPSFYEALKNKYGDNLNVLFIAQNKEEANDEYSKVGHNAHVIIASEYIEKNWNEFSVEQLYEFEKKYNAEPVWRYIYMDRFLINRSWDYAVKMACAYFCLFDKIFCQTQIDYYIDETIAVMASYIAYIVAKANGTDYCAQTIAKGFDSDYHYFLNTPEQYNCNFDPNYMDKSYSEDIIKMATDYFNKMHETYVKPAYMNTNGALPRFRLAFFKRPFYYLMWSHKERFTNSYDYIDYEYYKTVFNAPKFYFRYKACKKYYRLPDYKDKYALLPLHFQPEATTLICADRYEKQLIFIDHVAKSLPADTKLYVKEHYAFLGHRDSQFYKDLKKYPNVVLIDPLIQSKDLILHCESVVVLTSSVGWEATILGKPVIMCGKMAYQNAPGVVHIDDIYLNYLDALKSWEKPSDDDIVKYLCEHVSTMYKGSMKRKDDEKEEQYNLELLGESLVQEIERRKARNK